MALEHRLELKMLQKLILTPQLQQAIKLLQMPQLELTQMLANELIENPFLEEAVDGESEAAEGERVEETSREERLEIEETPAPVSEDREFSVEDFAEGSVEDYFESRSLDGRDLGYFTPDIAENESIDQFASQVDDLWEHLTWQLRFSDAADDVRAAAEVVIGNIDENGYLQTTVEDVAAFAETTPETAFRAIRLVQGFDPPGIGARDLKECLVLQLGPLGLRGTLVESLISDSLPELDKRKYQQLAEKHGATVEEIREAIRVIEGLDPRPGGGMSGGAPVYIKPDVYIVREGDDFRIVLSDESIPRVRINSFYRKLLMNKDSLEKSEREYLDERLRSAVWLLRSLDHRNKTIYRVAESIVQFQREFFLDGVSRLRPLNLKAVAGELGMHESTISRATANKYLSCAHGLFSFKFFFSSAVSTDSGAVSSTSVKEIIRKIVAEEDKRKPLSDQKITDMLKSFNIQVARRTVAKYREELNIRPQSRRKTIE